MRTITQKESKVKCIIACLLSIVILTGLLSSLYVSAEETKVTIKIDACGGKIEIPGAGEPSAVVSQKVTPGTQTTLGVFAYPYDDNFPTGVFTEKDSAGEKVCDSVVASGVQSYSNPICTLYFTITPKADTTYYVGWANAITATFDLNGGTCNNGLFDEEGLLLQRRAPNVQWMIDDPMANMDDNHFTRDGFNFKGWSTDKNASVGVTASELKLSKSSTAYAIWERTDYLVTIHGAKFSENDTTYEKTNLVPVGFPASLKGVLYDYYNKNPEKVCGGIFTEENGKGTLITDSIIYNENNGKYTYYFDVRPTRDLDYHVYWTEPVKLTLNANGGTFYDGTTVKTQLRAPGIKWEVDGTSARSYDVQRDGYSFAGWIPDKDSNAVEGLNDIVVNGNTTYYASWLHPNHTEEIIKGKDPTCTESGLTDGKKCSECGEILEEQQYIPALGHVYKDGVCIHCGNKLKANGVVKGPDGKWGYYKNDVLQEKYTGFQKNEYGYWYIVNGYVDFDRNDILRDGENGWWKVEGGKVNFNYTGVAKNKYGWWRVEGGLVNFNAQGIYKNDYGWWKTTDGKVTFKENGVFKNEYGWWKVEDSKVNFKYTGVAKNEYGWWRIEKGKVNFKFTGIAKNEYGTWYINKGKVDFNKNGKVKYDGKVYNVTNGKAKLA